MLLRLNPIKKLPASTLLSGTLFVPYLFSYVVNHLYDFLHVLFKDFMGNVKYN